MDSVHLMRSLAGRKSRRVVGEDRQIALFSIFVALFFLLNSGFFYEMSGAEPKSFLFDRTADFARFDSQEVRAANWLVDTKDNGLIYSDANRNLLIAGVDWPDSRDLSADPNATYAGSYIFLGTPNVLLNRVLILHWKGITHSSGYLDTIYLTSQRSRLYDNGGAQILR
jgi:uncharacterized membrane protein